MDQRKGVAHLLCISRAASLTPANYRAQADCRTAWRRWRDQRIGQTQDV